MGVMKKKFTPSHRVEQNIREAVESIAKTIKFEMDCAEIDHLRLSLDFDVNTTGKFLGVKVQAWQHKEYEHCYDLDVK